jgi:large subunit ribosomal protein L9
MKVILTESVSTLGNVGEIVNVSEGYGRNFLLPQQKAVIASEASLKELKNNQRRLQKVVDAEKDKARAIKNKLEGLNLEFIKRVGGNGKLFGTVTNTDISKALEEKNELSVPRRQIIIANPIKSVGKFDVVAKLFQEIEASFSVSIVMDPKQIEENKKKQDALEKKRADDKLEKEEEAKLAAEEEKTKEEEGPQTDAKTEEKRLREEADKILRGF